MGGQDKYGLWRTNIKIGKYVFKGCQGQISFSFLGLKVIMLDQVDFNINRSNTSTTDEIQKKEPGMMKFRHL